MTTIALSNAQLKSNADSFITEYFPKDHRNSDIIAGMMAIIRGNEETLEKMKNQKWFQRIWYTLTRKNSATVKEMQAKRDELTKYLVLIISRLSDMTAVNSAQTAELSSALLILDNEIKSTKVSIDKIARALNDKILSLDNFTFIKDEIRNGKYDPKQPLLSLIDIMSQLDERTARDQKRLTQLKETMETCGFGFDAVVNIHDYSKQVLSLPQEKVGRILLFCQQLSERSKFLNYTAILMENFFFLGETDRDDALKHIDSEIDSARMYSGLSADSECKMGNMLKDLETGIVDNYSKLEQMLHTAEMSVCLIGKSTRGKDSLKRALEKEFKIMSRDLNFDSKKTDSVLHEVKKLAEQQEVNGVIYCIDVPAGKCENTELNFINSLRKEFPYLKIVIALTQCVNESMKNDLAKMTRSETGIEPIGVLAEDFEVTDDIVVSAFGVDAVLEEIRAL